jgi:hypothetical protein
MMVASIFTKVFSSRVSTIQTSIFAGMKFLKSLEHNTCSKAPDTGHEYTDSEDMIG